ncbi:site-2 protease family protein [Inediibacterium massiliense]|uniref:site-2 protease family protein n=1 Tax=Inediibacterium massiliense TaxID=1658111 RepID=UPI0006B65B0F|nr:site-2 protease family protein [Inediibacterium massiliense]
MDIRQTLLIIPGIIIGFAFHEYAHAQVAVWLGDHTPQDEGRLSLNPGVHIDPFGFLFILLAGFGWAKPVHINENNFKNPKRDDILVSLAGPAMNLLIAIFFLTIMKITPATLLGNFYNTFMEVFDYTVWINVVLFVFNLLPIPPLDGSHILFGILGMKDKPIYYEIASKGRFILALLIITNMIDKIMGPPIQMVYQQLLSIFLFI